jgi:hypothetical protein
MNTDSQFKQATATLQINNSLFYDRFARAFNLPTLFANGKYFICRFFIKIPVTKNYSPGIKKRLVMTYSPTPTLGAVPSALAGLTTLFGMGRGVSPPLKSPAFKELKYVQIYHLPETD